MGTFKDIRTRFAMILEYGINEEVERDDMEGLIKYLSDLETQPHQNTVFKVAGRIIPRPQIEKMLKKQGPSGEDAKSSNDENTDGKAASKIDKKAMTGAELFGDKKAKMTVKSIENGVSIDGAEYKKQDVPDDDKLLKIYGSQEEVKKVKKSLEKYNKIIDLTTDAFKDSDNIETLSAVPNTPPTSPENRKKLKDGTADIISDGFLKQIPEGQEPTESQKKIMSDFKKLKDIKDPKEYDDQLMTITGSVMEDPYFKTGAADMIEMVSYMRELNEGNASYLPATSNFPLGDIISISPEKVDFEKDSPEEIQRKVKLIMTGVETRSVKKEAGAASASSSKTALSQYKEYTNKAGEKISPDTIKSDLTKISDKEALYTDIFDGDSTKAHNTVKELAKKYDFDLEDKDYKTRKNKSIESAIKGVKEDNPDIDEADLRKKYDAYYDAGTLYAKTYNNTVDSQLFTNESWSLDKKTGKAKVDISDGSTKLSRLTFQFNQGFGKNGRPSKAVPTKFKNDKQ